MREGGRKNSGEVELGGRGETVRGWSWGGGEEGWSEPGP